MILPPPAGEEKKISLNLSQFLPPLTAQPMATQSKQKPIKPPVPLPVTEKIIPEEPVKKIIIPTPAIKKKLLDSRKRLFAEKKERTENNVTKVLSQKEQKQIRKKAKKTVKIKTRKNEDKKVIQKKRMVKHTRSRKIQKRKRGSKDPLANALMGSGTTMYPASLPVSSGTYVTKMIKQLYGSEFNTFSPAQKRFIKENLGTIHRITQHTLTRNGYPDVAVRTRQQGTNVVSFYLHPDGRITGLRLKRRIGYAALDQNTLEVIRIAYKDYPRPKTKTKITFYVQYSIY